MLSCTYALVGVGFSLFFGALNVIHFAHGDVCVLGAFMTLGAYALSVKLGLTQSLPVWQVSLMVLMIGIFATCIVGILVERVSIRPFRQMPILIPLVADLPPRKMVDRIELYPKPIIAAVKGKCFYGGTGLAWPCDIRISGESGKFRTGDAYLGIVSSWGVGLVRTAHWIGRNRALDIMILGEIFDGKRAVELGIMSKVVPDSQLMEEAKAAARTIAQAAPIALRFIKEGVAMSIKGTYEEAKAKEVELVRKIYQTEDSQEGLAALLEDRRPSFKGR